jgi:hypothetical protein
MLIGAINLSLKKYNKNKLRRIWQELFVYIISTHYFENGWPGSSVGIATGYRLDGPGIKSRWGEIFRTCQTGPVAHPASCTMGTGSFPGVESGRGVTLTPHPLLVPRSKKSVELYLYSP